MFDFYTGEILVKVVKIRALCSSFFTRTIIKPFDLSIIFEKNKSWWDHKCAKKIYILVIRGSCKLNGIAANLFTESRRDNKKKIKFSKQVKMYKDQFCIEEEVSQVKTKVFSAESFE